jgi:hypothetical protein
MHPTARGASATPHPRCGAECCWRWRGEQGGPKAAFERERARLPLPRERERGRGEGAVPRACADASSPRSPANSASRPWGDLALSSSRRRGGADPRGARRLAHGPDGRRPRDGGAAGGGVTGGCGGVGRRGAEGRGSVRVSFNCTAAFEREKSRLSLPRERGYPSADRVPRRHGTGTSPDRASGAPVWCFAARWNPTHQRENPPRRSFPVRAATRFPPKDNLPNVESHCFAWASNSLVPNYLL